MGLIDKFQSDLSKFFNDEARRGDSIQTQLENSDKSINDFSDESRRGDSLEMQLENSNLSNSTQFQSTRLEDIPVDGVESFSTNQLVDSPPAEINPFSKGDRRRAVADKFYNDPSNAVKYVKDIDKDIVKYIKINRPYELQKKTSQVVPKHNKKDYFDNYLKNISIFQNNLHFLEDIKFFTNENKGFTKLYQGSF